MYKEKQGTKNTSDQLSAEQPQGSGVEETWALRCVQAQKQTSQSFFKLVTQVYLLKAQMEA